MTYDPRLTLARPDLADARLEGVLKAARYAPVTPMQAAAPVASLRTAAANDAEPIDELAFGEVFDLLEARDGWGWGQKRRSGVVGFVELAALAEPVLRPTHVVVTEAPVQADPDSTIAEAVLDASALVTVEDKASGWSKAARTGWLPDAALTPVEEAA